MNRNWKAPYFMDDNDDDEVRVSNNKTAKNPHGQCDLNSTSTTSTTPGVKLVVRDLLAQSALAAILVLLSLGAVGFYHKFKEYHSSFDNWCTEYQTASEQFRGIGNFESLSVVKVRKLHVLKLREGRRYVFVVRHDRHMYGFRISIFAEYPVRFTLSKYSLEHTMIQNLPHLYGMLLQNVMSPEKLIDEHVQLPLDVDWFLRLNINTKTNNLEANLCAENTCALKRFFLELRDQIRGKYIEIGFNEGFETATESPRGEYEPVDFRCLLFDRTQQLCRQNSTSLSVVVC